MTPVQCDNDTQADYFVKSEMLGFTVSLLRKAARIVNGAGKIVTAPALGPGQKVACVLPGTGEPAVGEPV